MRDERLSQTVECTSASLVILYSDVRFWMCDLNVAFPCMNSSTVTPISTREFAAAPPLSLHDDPKISNCYPDNCGKRYMYLSLDTSMSIIGMLRRWKATRRVN
jgi:hypothetical protein